MLYRIKDYFYVIYSKLRCAHPLKKIIPITLLAIALIIRIICGGTDMVYAIIKVGIFPPSWLYFITHIIRIILSGYMLAAVLSDVALREERLKNFLLTLPICLIVLIEYVVLFYKIRFFQTLLLTLIGAALSFALFAMGKKSKKKLILAILLFIFLEALLFIGVASVVISI